MGSSANIQQYCLRWNNHRSNLLLVFEHLFQTESFTDVTLACDGSSIKCHKMVLAACSSYFQHLLMENDCRHPIVILKDIRYSEIKAILEYMYKGEVNVAQDQLAGLLKAAETLKVKGLVEDNQSVSGTPTPTPTPPNQSPYPPPPPITTTPGPEYQSTSSTSYAKSNSNNSTPTPKFIPNESVYDSPYNASSFPDKNSIPFHLWPSSKIPSSPSPKHSQGSQGSQGSNSYDNSQNEPATVKKKKFLGANKDTPILRTVLGHTSLQHNAIESQPPIHYQHQPQPNQLLTPPHKVNHMPITLNGPMEINDKVRPESPDQSVDDSGRSGDSEKMHEENSSFSIESEDKLVGGVATYVPTVQKPEWKRYKQYTRCDIMAAIEAVREGMSALQAARKYGVPSRTLYDKVKKLGITTNRPYRKGSFPMSPFQGLNMKTEDTSISYSPEQNSLNISLPSNGIGIITRNGLDMDDKMDSDTGSNVKQEHSPPLDDEDKEDSNHILEEHNETGSRSSSSPRERDPSETEEMRSASDE